MNPRVRLILFLAAAAALAVPLGLGLGGLRAFGHYAGPYGILLNHQAMARRHVTNVVSAVNFDYRGIDTLGEEYILFAAVTGLALILRRMREQGREEAAQRQREQQKKARDQGQSEPSSAAPDRPEVAASGSSAPSDAVRWLGMTLLGLTVSFGMYVVVHGQLTPGGGFQGGAMLGTACLIVYLTTDYKAFREVSPRRLLKMGDSLGAGGYALIGLLTLAMGGAFLQNTLPLGRSGNLFSGGTVFAINLAVGLEVAAAFVLLFKEFLLETLPQGPKEAEKKEDEKGDPKTAGRSGRDDQRG
jgi:multicomponent Na+:H+ antiporter subunit B